MSAATTPPVTDDNLGNPLGWVYTLPLPPSQGGEVYKFTYGFVSSYSYMTVLYQLKKAEAELKALTAQEPEYPTKAMLDAGLAEYDVWDAAKAGIHVRDIYMAMRAAIRGEEKT